MTDKDFLRLIFLNMSAKQLQTEARAMQVTITEFMTAVLMLAVIRTEKNPINNAIGVDIPVNLRAFFESQSLRNFVFQVSTLLPVNGRQDWTLEEIADIVRGQIRAHLIPDDLQSILKGLVSLAKNPVVGIVPNVIKLPVLRILQARSHSGETTIITNLGNVKADARIAAHIERLEVSNGDTSGYGLPATCASVSFNDRFVFCISSANHDNAIWDEMQKILTENGIDVQCRTEDADYTKRPSAEKEKMQQKPFTLEKCKAYFHL